jgi:hypothetical protein
MIALPILIVFSSLAAFAGEPANLPVPPAIKRNDLTSVTKVVGEVGDRVVTSREVRINEAIDQALFGLGNDKQSVATGLEKTFPQTVGKVLDEWAVYFEAKSLLSSESSKEDIEKAIATVKGKWAENGAWARLEVSAMELRDSIDRKLVANSFSRLKTDPQLSSISDDEALTYYRKNRLKFGSLPFSSFKENIKSFLIKTQTEKRMTEWHEVLRKKYKVRNFISG